MLTPESTLLSREYTFLLNTEYLFIMYRNFTNGNYFDSKTRIPVQLFIHAYLAADKILSSNIYKTCHVTKLNYSIKTMSNGPYLMINATNARLH